MRLRLVSSVLLCGFLVACGSSDDGASLAEQTDAAIDGGQGDSKIDCAPAGATRFLKDCRIDRVAGANGLELTVHHPDGSFRRLLVTDDGRGVVAADGAAPAIVSIQGDNLIEVKVENDRYRLPATVKGAAG